MTMETTTRAGRSAELHTPQEDLIYIPARRHVQVHTGCRTVVRINAESYNTLVDLYNDSTLPMAQIASMLILNAAKRVRLVREGEYEAVRD